MGTTNDDDAAPVHAVVHTPGPWLCDKGSWVYSPNPAPGIFGSADTEYYGGHLICESVSRANAILIASAPRLLAACKRALELDSVSPNADEIYNELRKAIAAAESVV